MALANLTKQLAIEALTAPPAKPAASAAVSTLLKVMVDGSTPPSTKVRAADSVLNHSAKAMEIEDIEARVSELKRATEATKLAR